MGQNWGNNTRVRMWTVTSFSEFCLVGHHNGFQIQSSQSWLKYIHIIVYYILTLALESKESRILMNTIQFGQKNVDSFSWWSYFLATAVKFLAQRQGWGFPLSHFVMTSSFKYSQKKKKKEYYKTEFSKALLINHLALLPCCRTDMM